MCGIAGSFSVSNFFSEQDFRKASAAIKHRGPDGDGFYSDNFVRLAHRRLSIIDLDNRASQPMYSSCMLVMKATRRSEGPSQRPVLKHQSPAGPPPPFVQRKGRLAKGRPYVSLTWPARYSVHYQQNTKWNGILVFAHSSALASQTSTILPAHLG